MGLTRQILLLCAVAVLAGLGARVVQQEPVPFWGFPKPIELIAATEAIAGAATVSPDSAFLAADQPYTIDLSTAVGLFMKRKKAGIHFVDAREAELYEAGHIPGAVNIPYEALGEVAERVEHIPQEEIVVVYCEGGDCRLSLDLSEWLISNGWRRICVYEGGWEEWSLETDFIEMTEVEE